MSEWSICRIDDLGTVNRGKSKHRPRNDAILFGGSYPFIQTGDVKKANLYITEYDTTYSDVGLAQSKLWDKGTLCITIAANIAESAILGIDACFPDSVVGFLPHDGIADIKFVKYLLDEFKVYMQQISKGTTQDNLSLDKLRRVKFDVPDYHTQLKIANILSTYDELIEINQEKIKLLEQMAENLYKEWFVRFRFPGYKNTEFENGIPKGWRLAKLKDVAQEVGKPINKEKLEGYDYYLPIDCIPNKNMALSSVEDINKAESSLQSFKKGDILFGAMRPYFHKVLYSPIDGITRKTCFVINSINPEYSKWLYMLLYQKSTVSYASTVSVGSTMPYVRWKDFARMNVVVPDEKTVREFSGHIAIILERINMFFFENNNLIKQRDLLLPRLMSGKLEV